MQEQPEATDAKQPKSRKNVILIIVLVVGLIVVGVEGFLILQKMQQQNTKSITTTSPTVAVSGDIKTSPGTIPSSWVKFTSKKYGIGFATPKEWTVTEFDPASFGIKDTKTVSYKVTIAVPGDANGLTDFAASEGTVDEVLTRDTKGIANITRESLKWNSYDAINISTQGDKQKLLYVQIGKNTYNIPQYSQTPEAVLEKKVSSNDWKIFVDSIQISN